MCSSVLMNLLEVALEMFHFLLYCFCHEKTGLYRYPKSGIAVKKY